MKKLPKVKKVRKPKDKPGYGKGPLTSGESHICARFITQRHAHDPEVMHAEFDKLLIRIARLHGHDAACDWIESHVRYYA
jgi:hypothetical protein